MSFRDGYLPVSFAFGDAFSRGNPFSFPELRSSWPAPRIESSLTVRDSRTSDRSAQSRFFSKWRTKPSLLHEALNHGMEILDLSDITLKGKKYEGLKLSVLVISPLNTSNTRSNF